MAGDFEDYLTDAKLNINTTGRNDDFSDTHFYPYEATGYTVLKRLADTDLILASDCLLDYGSGKGRVPIYLNYITGCSSIGVEMMNEFYMDSLLNLSYYGKTFKDKASNITFIQYPAQKYDVPAKVNRIFFFNPFSVEIFKSVLKRIMESYYDEPRHIFLFFYYPQDEYVAHLAGIDEIFFYDEIDCRDNFPENDDRNKVLIYEIL
ncbi:MAG: SAM-dependent methyltransferase [Lachnospiraceae bacterium]|nr:SAM-dependent methyltransferase [Lachnospiraceae bacterium]